MKSKIFMFLTLMLFAKQATAQQPKNKKVHERDIVEHILDKAGNKQEIATNKNKFVYGILTYYPGEGRLKQYFTTARLMDPKIQYQMLYHNLNQVLALTNHPQIKDFEKKGLITTIYEINKNKRDFSRALNMQGKEIANLMGEFAFRSGDFRDKIKSLDDVYKLLKQERFVDEDYFKAIGEHVKKKVPKIKEKSGTTNYEFGIYHDLEKYIVVEIQNELMNVEICIEEIFNNDFKPNYITVEGFINGEKIDIEMCKDPEFDINTLVYLHDNNNQVKFNPTEISELYKTCLNICYDVIERENIREKVNSKLSGQQTVQKLPAIKRDFTINNIVHDEVLENMEFPKNGFRHTRTTVITNKKNGITAIKKTEIGFEIEEDEYNKYNEFWLEHQTTKKKNKKQIQKKYVFEIEDWGLDNTIDELDYEGNLFNKKINGTLETLPYLDFVIINHYYNFTEKKKNGITRKITKDTYLITKHEAQQIYDHCKKKFKELIQTPEMQNKIKKYADKTPQGIINSLK